MSNKKPLNDLTLEEYDTLQDCGMLFEFYPEATGNWKKDLTPVYFNEERIDTIAQNGNTGEHYNDETEYLLSNEANAARLRESMKQAEKGKTKENEVKHPRHYLILDTEAIELIHKSLSKEEFRGYCLGNILKYRLRAGKKGDAVEDLAKALEYEKIWGKYGK